MFFCTIKANTLLTFKISHISAEHFFKLWKQTPPNPQNLSHFKLQAAIDISDACTHSFIKTKTHLTLKISQILITSSYISHMFPNPFYPQIQFVFYYQSKHSPNSQTLPRIWKHFKDSTTQPLYIIPYIIQPTRFWTLLWCWSVFN